MKNLNNRTTNYAVGDLFLQRYSPRALSGEKLSEEELMSLFDAARWAPSAYNTQPWRFIYAENGTENFPKFLSFLSEWNQGWCAKASALVVVVSQKKDAEHEFATHTLDTGAAWENLALQATQNGLIAHGMSGFDYTKAQSELGIPENFAVEMMIAIGKPGKIEDLPEAMRGGETPNDRKPLEEIVFEGKFIA